MGMIKRLNDKDGDTALATWDPADTISVEEARKVFDALVADPRVGLAQIEDATKNISRKVTTFDPAMEQIIVWNQVVGG